MLLFWFYAIILIDMQCYSQLVAVISQLFIGSGEILANKYSQ